MIDQIIKAISLALNGAFGDDYTIYKEEAEQDMKEPCFFVICNTPKKRLFRGRKYFCSYDFCIKYVPSTGAVRAECNETIEKMFECLEYIRLGESLVRGKNMEPEIKDGILYFFVAYEFFVYKKTETEKMGEVLTKVGVKGQVEDGSKEKG